MPAHSRRQSVSRHCLSKRQVSKEPQSDTTNIRRPNRLRPWSRVSNGASVICTVPAGCLAPGITSPLYCPCVCEPVRGRVVVRDPYPAVGTRHASHCRGTSRDQSVASRWGRACRWFLNLDPKSTMQHTRPSQITFWGYGSCASGNTQARTLVGCCCEHNRLVFSSSVRGTCLYLWLHPGQPRAGVA